MNRSPHEWTPTSTASVHTVPSPAHHFTGTPGHLTPATTDDFAYWRNLSDEGHHSSPPPPYDDSVAFASAVTTERDASSVVAPVPLSAALELPPEHADEDEQHGLDGEDTRAERETTVQGVDAPLPRFDSEGLIVARNATFVVAAFKEECGADTAFDDALVAEEVAKQCQRVLPWVMARGVAAATDGITVFIDVPRSVAEELFRQHNGAVPLGRGMCFCDWPQGEERVICRELVQRLSAERVVPRWIRHVLEEPGGGAALEVTSCGIERAGSCSRCGVFVTLRPTEVTAPWACRTCFACLNCQAPHADCPRWEACRYCHSARPPLAKLSARRAWCGELRLECSTRDTEQRAGDLEQSLQGLPVTVSRLVPTNPGRPGGLSVLFPRETVTDSSRSDELGRIMTSAFIYSGLFPALQRVLSSDFALDLADDQPGGCTRTVVGPSEYLLSAALWLLLQVPGTAKDIVPDGFAVYGGVVRDFVLRRVFPVEDIDISCPFVYLNRAQGTGPTFLADVLRRALDACPLVLKKRLRLRPLPPKPGVPERACLALVQPKTTSGAPERTIVTVDLEMADSSQFDQCVDMSFNNVMLTRAGLLQRFPGQGGTLLTVVRDVLQRRGHVVDAERNTLYSRRRRFRRGAHANEVQRYELQNVFDPTAPPSDWNSCWAAFALDDTTELRLQACLHVKIPAGTPPATTHWSHDRV